MGQQRIIIVDDERDILTGLQRILKRNLPDVKVDVCSSPEEALRLQNKSPSDVALVDIQMPEMDGIALMEKLHKQDNQMTVIVMTAYGTIEVAVDAMKKGAYNFVTKPFEKDVLVQVLRKALERSRLISENRNLKETIAEKKNLSFFVGESPPMKRLFETIKTIAQTDYTVLVRGESGTGKELAARAIHLLSKRAKKELVSVNCPAVPEHLLESELFGHVKGAFTGADRDHKGLFVEANGGTICLDEVADIPVHLQTKLLRVLQEQEIKPLGDSGSHKVNVRVVALTNQNIEEKITSATFREDLFYRLNVITLWLPTLREIREDIPLLVASFSKKICQELGLTLKIFSAEALQELMLRPWPGNVRELQNVVRRAIMFSSEEIIKPMDLQTPAEPERHNNFGETNQFSLDSASNLEPYKLAKESIVHNFEKTYVQRLLTEVNGNVTRAAELSGLTRAALQKIMKRLDFKSVEFKDGKV